MNEDYLKEEALKYHRSYPPGKAEIVPTKPMSNRHDLSLAYSPGVAYACKEIQKDESESFNLTSRGNTVAVITNGSAVLGLGNIGPYASKPVMEGKAVLFKKFANINGIDLEVDCADVDQFCDLVAALEPSFGGVNLEDIKAPQCFEIERRLIERMNIPVFHDDQHGTAIIATAGLLNALSLISKEVGQIRVVCNGAGAAGISILDMLLGMGVPKANITLCDSQGVVHTQRTDINSFKQAYAQDTPKRSLAEAVKGADVFIGVSVAGALSADMLLSMNSNPIVFALANPDPEIKPDLARQVRSDVIIATGRSDFANQINNVLCFPFLFRGALDVRATRITMEMKLAAADAIAALARREIDEATNQAYEDEDLLFSKDLLIPKPFDKRLIEEVSIAVAKAAEASGVAAQPISDYFAYRKRLQSLVDPSVGVIQHLLPKRSSADQRLKRLAFADGEDLRVLRAAQMLIDDQVAHPILIGNRELIESAIAGNGLRILPGHDAQILDPSDYPEHAEYSQAYHELAGRHGISPQYADVLLSRDSTMIGAMLLHKGAVDGLLCGLDTQSGTDMQTLLRVLELEEGVSAPIGVNSVLLSGKPVFIADTLASENPDAERLVEITRLGAQIVEDFDLEPKVALISHSSFGSSPLHSSRKMQAARALLEQRLPDLVVEGEMTPEVALNPRMQARLLPANRLQAPANLLVMPNLDAANVAYRILQSAYRDGFTIGPVLSGFKQSVNILSKLSSVRRIYNMSVITANRATIDDHQASSTKQK